MKRPVLLAPFFLLLLSLGCSSGERSTETSPTLPAQREWLDEMGSGFDDNDRQTIRELAETYVRAQVLGCTVRGISTMPFTGNLFLVGVDLSCGNERKTAELGARRFYPPDGTSPYWKVEPLTPTLSRALSGYAVKKLEGEVEAEYEDYSDERDFGDPYR